MRIIERLHILSRSEVGAVEQGPDDDMELQVLKILNSKSTDPSKIYLVEKLGIVRTCNATALSTLKQLPERFLYQEIVDKVVVLKPARFHNNVSCWNSAQLGVYVKFMEELFAELAALQVSLIDGHPWNCIFHHGRLYHIDFGSISAVYAPDAAAAARNEMIEFSTLANLYPISYLKGLRRKLAEEVHGPQPFRIDDILRHAFNNLAANDCHVPLVERYNRIFVKSYTRKGPWIGYRPTVDFESQYDSDPRMRTLENVIVENKIESAIDIGANDGLHSYFMAKECGAEVLSLEYEDFNSSRFFQFAGSASLPITCACATLEDYVFHLGQVSEEFLPKIELAVLFAVYHHLCHDFGYSASKLLAELAVLKVRLILLEFVDYTDKFLSLRPRLPGYSVEALQAECESQGCQVKVFPAHELGRRLVLIGVASR
ncbi:MAG TPA: hypothetical protein VHX52_06430 [Steroidobacteraceae bacterium]|jgi:hypothetical protein|nr:hypothetical protein [Steroidobacteraceae bacterium]